MNNVVLVTGSTSGIGLGIAREFAKAGYAVGFHGLEKDGADIASSIGRQFDVPVCFSDHDLTDQNGVAGLVHSRKNNCTNLLLEPLTSKLFPRFFARPRCIIIFAMAH